MCARVDLEWESAPVSSTQPSFGQMLTPGIRPAYFWCVINHESGSSPAAQSARFTGATWVWGSLNSNTRVWSGFQTTRTSRSQLSDNYCLLHTLISHINWPDDGANERISYDYNSEPNFMTTDQIVVTKTQTSDWRKTLNHLAFMKVCM